MIKVGHYRRMYNSYDISELRSSRILGLSVYALLFLPYLHYVVLYDYQNRSNTNIGAILSLAGIVTSTLLLLVSSAIEGFRVRIIASKSFIFLLSPFIVAFAVAQTGISPAYSMAYAAISIWVLIISQPIYYALLRRNFSDLRYVAWMILGFTLFLLFYHEVTFPRKVGGIQPNSFAKMVFVTMVIGYIANVKYRRLFLLSAIAASIFAASRGSMILLFTFLSYYSIITGGLTFYLLTMARVVAFGSLILILIKQTFPGLIDVLLNEVLAVSDSKRSILSSGFTGRVDHWQDGIAALLDGSIWSKIFGYGLATRDAIGEKAAGIVEASAGAHNGYINLVLDTGFLGAALFILAALYSVVLYTRQAKIEMRNQASAASASFIVTYLVSMMIDPIYITIGTPFSFLFIFLIVNASTHRVYRKLGESEAVLGRRS